ncbi:MAG: hypothetical protein KDF58_10915 [Alphaproteobacteria bacterium]|nr:hypothetical protein [Alphaproteobacteria bacterium]HRW28460.1 hypothetical protein [Emcibacteraceae bacterium]
MKPWIISILLGVGLMASTAFAADVDGNWSISMTAAEGATMVSMSVAVSGEVATAMIGSDTLAGTYKNGELKLTGPMYVPEAGMSSTLNMIARYNSDQLIGTAVWDVYDIDVLGTRKN